MKWNFDYTKTHAKKNSKITIVLHDMSGHNAVHIDRFHFWMTKTCHIVRYAMQLNWRTIYIMNFMEHWAFVIAHIVLNSLSTLAQHKTKQFILFFVWLQFIYYYSIALFFWKNEQTMFNVCSVNTVYMLKSTLLSSIRFLLMILFIMKCYLIN